MRYLGSFPAITSYLEILQVCQHCFKVDRRKASSHKHLPEGSTMHLPRMCHFLGAASVPICLGMPPSQYRGSCPKGLLQPIVLQQRGKGGPLECYPCLKKMGFGFTLPEGNTVLLSKLQIA